MSMRDYEKALKLIGGGFWDGEKEWKISRPLSEEEKGYPRLSLPDAPLLLKWIRDDYRVEKDYI